MIKWNGSEWAPGTDEVGDGTLRFDVASDAPTFIGDITDAWNTANDAGDPLPSYSITYQLPEAQDQVTIDFRGQGGNIITVPATLETGVGTHTATFSFNSSAILVLERIHNHNTVPVYQAGPNGLRLRTRATVTAPNVYHNAHLSTGNISPNNYVNDVTFNADRLLTLGREGLSALTVTIPSVDNYVTGGEVVGTDLTLTRQAAVGNVCLLYTSPSPRDS